MSQLLLIQLVTITRYLGIVYTQFPPSLVIAQMCHHTHHYHFSFKNIKDRVLRRAQLFRLSLCNSCSSHCLTSLFLLIPHYYLCPCTYPFSCLTVSNSFPHHISLPLPLLHFTSLLHSPSTFSLPLLLCFLPYLFLIINN